MRFLSKIDDRLFSLKSTIRNTYTAVGYADGISAGTHVFTTTYSYQPLAQPGTYTCSRDADAYLIEIEEIP